MLAQRTGVCLGWCVGWCVCVCCLRRRGWLTVAGWLRFACRRLASLLGRQHDAEVSGRFQGVSPCYRKLFRSVGRDGTGWDGMDPASPVRGCWPCPGLNCTRGETEFNLALLS